MNEDNHHLSKANISNHAEDLEVEAIYQRTVALHQQGQLHQAQQLYLQIIKKHPHHLDSLNMLGVIAYQTGHLDEALNLLAQAIAMSPNNAELYNNRGNILSKLNRLDEALKSYTQAITLKPQFAEALNNLGSVLKTLHRFKESLACYEQAIQIKPSFAEACNNLGNLYESLQQPELAIRFYQRAIVLKPQYAEAYFNQANVLSSLGLINEAIASYQTALNIHPDYPFALGALVHCKMKLCDWQTLDHDCNQLTQGILDNKKVSTPFVMLGLTDDPALQLACAQIFARAKFSATTPPAETTSKHDGKIRIGYYSSDFHCHATSYLIAELLESHDASKFEIFGFSFGPKIEDEMYLRVSKTFDYFYEVAEASDTEIAAQSRALGIDIAIDLKGFTQHARMGIFANRCAPIQVNFLGYPGSLGATFYDYIIADKTVIPAHHHIHYAEKIIYLPTSYQVNDAYRKICTKPIDRLTHDLPEHAFVFCCFNASYKILPSTFDIWMRLLSKVDHSVLWLIEDNKMSTEQLQKQAELRGVSPQRLIFAKKRPLAQHLARHQLADLFLDTVPCNAHTSASDALWSGLPVLTCVGQSFASRVAASLLNALHLTELITHDLQAYEAKAYDLATHRDKLNKIKQTLAQEKASSALFSGQQFAKHIENAYLAMHARRLSGLAPYKIDLSN
jgi:protein O-GlcNAc transferase